MFTRPAKSFTRLAVLAALALLMLFTDTKPAAAATCFADLAACYGKAAGRDGYFAMWIDGLDCELTFTDCTRRAIIGR